MNRIVSPALDQLDKLRQPLTSGEKKVVELFNAELPDAWEIYIQPHLNGLRPDIVLLNPNVGIAVFEIKDWNLNAMDYWTEQRPEESPKLMGRKGGKTFSLQSQNPVDKVNLYRQEIFELYCPRLDSQFGFAAITAGVIFPYSSHEAVSRLLAPSLQYRGMTKHPRYSPVAAMEAVAAGRIDILFPESARPSSMVMRDDLANDLRSWLVEPDVSESQRQPLVLDSNQKELVNSRTQSGYRRVRGPAGSGKSIVLAARAARLLSEGKKVLVVSYNITLLHYLMDIAVRAEPASGKTRSNVTWLNFHAWCKRVCTDSDHEDKYRKLWIQNENTPNDRRESVLSSDLPSLVSWCIDNSSLENIQMFDAILVDEGQDFLPSWWNVLRKVCRPAGEMLLVADATQDVYGTARSWTDKAMTGAGFPGGRWSELRVSYRLPRSVITLVRGFAEKFLPNDTVNLPESRQAEIDIFPCKLKWVHTSLEMAVDTCVHEVLAMAPEASPELLSIADITFLADQQRHGRQVVDQIKEKGVKSVHTFSGDGRDSRRLKMGFYMGDARIKATTLHSFKGWESRALVVFVGSNIDQKTLALLYTGLTRVKCHTEGSFLTVVSSSDDLKAYGKTWPIFEESDMA